MSLINLRRDRKRLGHGVKRPMSLARLFFLLVVVGGLIWWLSRLS